MSEEDTIRTLNVIDVRLTVPGLDKGQTDVLVRLRGVMEGDAEAHHQGAVPLMPTWDDDTSAQQSC